MDIKDVNNANNPLLFNRNSAQNSSAAALGAGFASLIGQGAGNLSADLLPPSAGADREMADARSDNRADNGRQDAKREDKAVDADTRRPEDKKAARAEKKIQEKIRAVTEDVAREAIAAPAVQNQVEAVAPVEDDGISEIESVAGGDKAVTPVLADGEPAVEFPNNLEISGEDDVKLEDFAIKLSDLAKMGSVTFLNPETGEAVTMNGADLAAKLAAAAPKTDATLVSPGEEGVIAAEIVAAPAAVAAENMGEEVIAAAMDGKQNAAMAGQGKVKATQTAAGVEYKDGISEEMQSQNAELAEMLDGKNVKIEVNVKEEKISYLKGQDLVKDRLALDKAVAAADSGVGDGMDAGNPVLTPVNSNAPKAPAGNAPAFTPLANAAVAAVIADSAADGAAKVAVEIAPINNTSVTSAAAGLSGSELTNAAKAEINAKTADASFRDVYKGMSKEAVEQVKVNITKSAVKGVDSISVRLKPEDLGQIEIKMQIKDGKLQAQIISSRPETMDILQKEAGSLEKAFNDAGFQTDEGSLSFSYQGGNQAGENQERNSGLRNFIGEVFENEAGTDLASDIANQNWISDKGLNIRV